MILMFLCLMYWMIRLVNGFMYGVISVMWWVFSVFSLFISVLVDVMIGVR